MKISVLMSVYKEPVEWMRQSIDSILNQTYTDFEFIIINDKPDREENAQLLNEYAQKDNRVKIITNEENIGLTKSLNKGISVAQGKYIARMDADDISLPQRFEKQVKVLESNESIGVLGTAVQYFGAKKGLCLYPISHQDVYLFLTSCFAHPSVMGRREIFTQLKYDESFRFAQDYDLWERMYEIGVEFSNLEEPLVLYRMSQEQISTSQFNLQSTIASSIRRRALLFYMKNWGISDIDLNHIDKTVMEKINKNAIIPTDVLKQLNYLLLLSSDYSLFELINDFFSNGSVSFNHKLRLLFHKCLNHKIRLI